MLPESGSFLKEPVELDIYPTKTYGMRIEEGRIVGQADGLEAMNQAVYKALSTQRSAYPAYSDNYGAELTDLIGMPMSYVLPEFKRRIAEALTWDSRIDSVDGFAFETGQGRVLARFTVHTIFGDAQGEWEVPV